MKRLELVIVQFDEAKRLIDVGRVPQLRLALILLDSAVELIMHRMIKSELRFEGATLRRLETYRRVEAEGRATEEIRAEIRELENKVLSNTRRKKIRDQFPAKVDFLVERDRLPADIALVLKRLHEYRNETYHRDKHRLEVIRPAVLVYFDAACTVLSCYRPDSYSVEQAGPEVMRFQRDVGLFSGFDLPQWAAEQLRREVGLDLPTLRAALGEHLIGRLHELEQNIAEVEGVLPCLHPGDGLRIIQIPDGDMESMFDNDVMRKRKYPHSESDLVVWRQRSEALASIANKHQLFTEFAAIEMEFEGLEQKALDAVISIDRDIQNQVDAYRGK